MELAMLWAVPLSIALTIVAPYQLGRRMRSAWVGLILVSIMPALGAFLGFITYRDLSSDPDAAMWAFLGLVMVAAGVVCEVFEVLIWGLGRRVRHRNHYAQMMTKTEADHDPSNN